jgi:ABC-type phosphate/phosphonate transport system ATPase subunit
LLQPVAKRTERPLSGVSFTVGAGQAAALIGANGVDKSTLLRILATLIIPVRYPELFRCGARRSRILKLLYPWLLVNHCRLQYSFCQAPKGGRQ